MEKVIRTILRAIRHYVYRLLEIATPYVTSRQYLGFTLFYIKGPGIVDRIRFMSPKRIYEKELCEKIAEQLKTKDHPVFIDIGANLGLISLYIQRHVPNVKIYAFEPGIQQRSLFGLTIAKNKLEEKIQLFAYAVSNEDKLTLLTTYEHSVDGSGDGLVNTRRVPNNARMVPVETVTLDSFISHYQISQVDVIKIDIEGAELLAFNGAKETITKYRPIIHFELNPLNLRSYPHTAEDVVTFLTNYNYIIYDLEGNECTLKTVHELMKKDDVFMALPK
jgi:FkbM family methyltransferase